jgi:exosome complex RNA-binding protein Rrp42 (RNase PH superfamily)
LIDPTAEEEAMATASITMAITEEGNIGGIQKRGLGYFEEKEFDRIVEISLSKGKELIELIKQYTK